MAGERRHPAFRGMPRSDALSSRRGAGARRAPASPRKRGQAIVFLVLALTILAFVFLWNVDLHRLVASKSLAQNGGDAAALAAARWQGDTLNLIGELNVMHALVLAGAGEPGTPEAAAADAAVDAITNIQARLCLTGPMVALMAAQVAAKNNRLYADPGFSDVLRDHASGVLSYGDTVGGAQALDPPFPGAWEAYAAMLRSAAEHGIAAGPDNARFYNDATGGHILRTRDFYEAVAGRNWCWFFLHQKISDNPPRTLLDVYTDYTWWEPLPEPDPPSFFNCEIFGLGVAPVTTGLRMLVGEASFREGAASLDGDIAADAFSNAFERVETWYVYEDSLWHDWEAIQADGPDAFPVVGPVKREYNVAGADAVVRVYASADRIGTSSGMERDDVLWTAAAKPFGYLASDSVEGGRLPANAFGLLFPAFRAVRLIPVDTASGSDTGAFDLPWRRHLAEHLPPYTAHGTLQDGCRYCNILRRWENPAFRKQGSLWLEDNSGKCRLPAPHGGGRGGGTRRGH
jgi:hypothetical protein